MKNLFDHCELHRGTIIVNMSQDDEWCVGYQYPLPDGSVAFYAGAHANYPTAVAQVLSQLPKDNREISSRRPPAQPGTGSPA